MNTDHAVLRSKIHSIASSAPCELVAALASAIESAENQDWDYARSQILSAVPSPALRVQVMELLDSWQSLAPGVRGNAIALALLTAAESEKAYRASQRVDLVWTGPDSRVIPLRRTDQTLLQVINGATSRLLIVSFAVYKIEAISKAMAVAASRGVDVSVCVESPDESEGRVAYDAVRALGSEVRTRAHFYIWPLAKRPKSSEGKHGSLHSKVAVADGRILLISSANLTEYAMSLNMELGVYIQGGDLPGEIERHFEQLILTGVLQLLQ